MSRTPLLLDVDTGVDDAMALTLATRLETYQLVAVTTVAGNVPIENTTANTARVLDWLGADVPVYRGMDGPLARPLHSAPGVHGDDGLGGWSDAAVSRLIEPETAPEAIIRHAREYQGDIAFGFVGPLTNLAVALSLEPRIVEWVPRLVIMGGAFFGPGNVTASAEFNIYVDPEAAAAVARSSFKTTWVGLDVTRQTVLSREQWDELADSTVPEPVLMREVCRQSFEQHRRPVVTLHDPLAVAAIEQPDILQLALGSVRVDSGPYLRGETRLVGLEDDEATHRVARGVDVPGFDRIFGRIRS